MTTNRVIADNDPHLRYETPSVITQTFHFFVLPFLNNLPIKTQGFIKRTHTSARQVIEKATTHEAIEVLYNNDGARHSQNFFQRIFYRVWFSTNNPKAVRNRLKLVEREVKKVIIENLEQKNYVSILSIASGSSRAVVEVLDRINLSHHDLRDRLAVAFLDKNPGANDYSKRLVADKDSWLVSHCRWITDTATNFSGYYEAAAPANIIEMVGLLDYFDDAQVLKIFKAIYEHLPSGGALITANIMDNKERKFVTNVVGWKMIYREPAELMALAEKAGFLNNKITAYCEPLKIHFVMVARK